jgi:hypothetical protein
MVETNETLSLDPQTIHRVLPDFCQEYVVSKDCLVLSGENTAVTGLLA